MQTNDEQERLQGGPHSLGDTDEAAVVDLRGLFAELIQAWGPYECCTHPDRRNGCWGLLPWDEEGWLVPDPCNWCRHAHTYVEGEAKERSRVERGGDLHALITDGHNLRLELERIREAFTSGDDEALHELIHDSENTCYEWEKRARRAGVDWWNR